MEKVSKVFCTTRQAARQLGVSVSTTQLWVESGLLEAWKTEGGHRRISRESVQRLLLTPGTQGAVVGHGMAHEPPPASLYVLVVEDDTTLRRMYEVRMNTWRCRPTVRVAANGFDALLRIGISRPDLLITDLRMPHMDGFEMLRSLKRLPECAQMKIVVVTGLDQAEIDAAGGLPEGIVAFPKPAPFQALESVAEEILSRRGLVPG
jgi:excisionase family DNA binding protein